MEYRVPDGTVVYAVGDIHGCRRQLDSMLDLIHRDIAATTRRRHVVVFLGDYVDRGPDSRGVMELLLSNPIESAELVFLKGNHEDLFLQSLYGADREEARMWCLGNGGIETEHSYGISGERDREMFPCRHLDFMRGLRPYHVEGECLFVHAGIRPGIPLEGQSEHDLLWIREPFLSSGDSHGVMVVHGHTPAPSPQVRDNRIGIDTGVFHTGTLTALVVEKSRYRFLQVRETGWPADFRR